MCCKATWIMSLEIWHWFSGEEGRLVRATPAPTPKRCIHDERTGGAYHIHVPMRSDGGQLREDDLNITVHRAGVGKGLWIGSVPALSHQIRDKQSYMGSALASTETYSFGARQRTPAFQAGRRWFEFRPPLQTTPFSSTTSSLFRRRNWALQPTWADESHRAVNAVAIGRPLGRV